MADTMTLTSSTTPVSNKPGDDEAVGRSEDGRDITVLTAIKEYKREAMDARRTRLHKNRENRRAYLGIQDFSHKGKGQSQEFLPKMPVAVEQLTAFIKRALVQFGAYYSVELGRDSQSPLSGEEIRRVLDTFLNNLLVADNVESYFPVLLADTIKAGSLESLCILKIHGAMKNKRQFTVESGDFPILDGTRVRRPPKEPDADENSTIPEQDEPQLVMIETPTWQLRIDLIEAANYLPDPTGEGLYEIHTSEKDLHYVIQRAEEGIYDKAAVARIKEDFRRQEDQDTRPLDKNQDEAQKPSFRKRVRIDEFWGTIIDGKGHVIHENAFCAVANGKYLIRRPQPNPFWHQESPFVAVPLIRVPFSTWHKALFDHATQLNFAANELFNLIIDGGISSVWGIKQLYADHLADPSQVSDGIAQGDTLVVKNTLPHGSKVLETVSEGKVPADAMIVLEMLNREFTAAALSNELKLGSLPAKQVKATEITELSQSQAITLDSIIGDIERDIIGKVLRLSWLNILQNMDDVSSGQMISAIGLKAAFILSRMTPMERFATFAGDSSFTVFGLSAVMAKVRDFQKLMALLNAVMTNPILMQAFFTKYSPDKILSHIMKTLSVNPEQMQRDSDEIDRLMNDLQQLPIYQQLTGTAPQQGGGPPGQGGEVGAAQNTGDSALPAQIAANSNPTASLAGIGNS